MNPVAEKLKSYSYHEMADKSGLNINTIRSLARMTNKELLGIRIRTALILLDRLDIAILSNHKNYQLIKK